MGLVPAAHPHQNDTSHSTPSSAHNQLPTQAQISGEAWTDPPERSLDEDCGVIVHVGDTGLWEK